MTDNTDLFSSSADDKSAPPVDDSTHDYLADLVGDGKKYRDVQSLAKSLVHKEMHIRDIEKENAEFRQVVQQGLTREEFYEAIKALKEPSPSSQPQGGEQERNEVSVEQIRSLVNESVNQTMSEAKQQENLRLTIGEAQRRLGPNFQKILKDRALELGESEADLTTLAMNKPKVFLELMTPKPADNPHIPGLPRSEVDPVKQPHQGTEVRNMSYYRKLKQSDPQKYKSQAMELQMHKDAIVLGEKFFQ